jgi:hypothetical protein
MATIGAAAFALAGGLYGAPSAFAAPPPATITGMLVGGGELSGAATAFVQDASPTDQIGWVTLTVDGVVRDRSNSGLLMLDTSTLTDGTHPVSIDATGGASDSGQIWSGLIETANAPLGGSATIAGDPRQGQTLLAQTNGWSPQPAEISYQWQRCDAAGDPCTAIAGATQSSYAAVAADDYGRLAVSVTASDTGGSTIVSSSSGVVADAAGNTTPPSLSAPLGAALGRVAGPAASGTGAGAAPSAGGSDVAAGSPAPCRKPRLRAQVAGGASAAVAFGQRVILRGSLRCGAAAIKGAALTVELTPTAGTGPARRISVRTNAAGSFDYRIPAGPSRRVRVTYGAGAGGRRLAASAGARVVVTPEVSLAITPTHTANGHTITFSGAVSGGYEPAGGLPLELEYREGDHWLPYQVVRTDPRDGRFRYRYTFRRTTQAITYTFRFVIPPGGVEGYPFAAAASPARSVQVVP